MALNVSKLAEWYNRCRPTKLFKVVVGGSNPAGRISPAAEHRSKCSMQHAAEHRSKCSRIAFRMQHAAEHRSKCRHAILPQQ